MSAYVGRNFDDVSEDEGDKLIKKLMVIDRVAVVKKDRPVRRTSLDAVAEPGKAKITFPTLKS